MSESFRFANAEGLLIRGDVHAPAGRGPVVVCVHGFKGFKDWGFWPQTAERLVRAGMGAVRFNFAHSGVGEDLERFGEPRLFESGTYSREVSDLREVLVRLAGKDLPGAADLDTARIGLLAHSRGAISAVALAASEDGPVRSVALWNPVATALWWSEEERRRWRERGFWEVVNTRTREIFRITTALLDDAESNGDRLDPVSNARRLAVPLSVVVARGDESVSPESGRRLARAAPSSLATLTEIEDSGHTFGAVHPFAGSTPAFDRAIGAAVEHFARTLGAAA
ncbi:MAG TPA: hypothetical protein VKJ00_05480 [Thermoanaerobaculia bacterium]|nr:hypothetical protein [Thermoanaerobaculia bacterium]